MHTKALHISGNTVKLAGRTWGSLEDIYTTMELKSASGLQITGNMLTIHTDGLQNGRGEITISNVAPGDYYVSVMTNMNWEVTIYEGM